MKNRVKTKPKTAAQRRKKCDDLQRSIGRTGRKIWATPEEHEKIKELLVSLREK